MPEMLWHATPVPDVVTIPERRAIAYDGAGPPEGPAFQRAVTAVYGLAYTLKFTRKRRGKDFRIGPLEARWWAEGASLGPAPRESWRWRLRIAVPHDVTDAELAFAVTAATSKKRGKLVGLTEVGRVYVEHIAAQRVGRALHVGPYADEPRTLDAIDRSVIAGKLVPGRSHVEIYLKDPRRTKPAKLETVLLRELA